MMKRDILTPAIVIGGIVLVILFLWAVIANAQTHTMPGSNVVPSGASLTISSGATITAAGGSTVTGFGGGTGTVTSITATTPIVVTPTPLIATGVVSLDKIVDLAMTGTQSVTVSDAATNSITDILTLGHNSTGTPLGNFGSGILFKLEDSTTNDISAGEIQTAWTTTAHNSTTSKMIFRLTNGGSSLATPMTLNGTGILDVSTGYTIGGVATSGRIMQANGTQFMTSNVTWPTSASSTGAMVQANGTNFVASTPTWPTAAGAAGYTIRSDATNFASFPAQLINSSTTSQSPSTSDVYLAGSNIVVTAGDFKAKGQYKCVFDMTKSAGTGSIVITLRVGTAGTTSDAAIQTYTFAAGTSVADLGMFEVVATWRTVGSGTSAVMQGMCRATHQLTTTGLISNAAGWMVLGSPSPSSGFASNTATNIGLSFNGSTAFAGTATLVQAQLQQ